MARDLFQREAKILGKIGNHPQLPRLLDYFETNNVFFLVQEYVSGLTLQQEVRRGGPFSESGAKQFLSELLPVMQYIHSHQVIHRDIKPANLIRRDQDKRLVLIDFGAVKDKVNSVKATQSEQTVFTAYAIGTPGYAPPEQMAMRPVYASDIYAIGVTCVYLLTGKSPKDLSYDPQTGEMLWQEQVQVSPHFAKVLCKMLEISVRHRYHSAEAILRDLDLEPYLDSLAQNMAFTAAGAADVGEDNSDGMEDDESLSSGFSSPSARLAAAIRARRERANARLSTATRRYRRSVQLPTSQAGTSTRSEANPAAAGKLTAPLLKRAYERGHRDFSMQVLNLLDLQRCTLTGASFAKAEMKKVNLQGADLVNVNFGKADLAQATLRNARLGGAYFGEANLTETDLRGADLSRACLKEANLRGANLCGADLTEAEISEAQLSAARTNWSTVYPNGKRGIR
jgi:serine/threonine-protein kinase